MLRMPASDCRIATWAGAVGRPESGDYQAPGRATLLAMLTPTRDDVRTITRAALIGLELRKQDVIPEVLPPEIGITRDVRTVLVADVVESVRLMQEDEAGTVQRWRALSTTSFTGCCQDRTADWSRAWATD